MNPNVWSIMLMMFAGSALAQPGMPPAQVETALAVQRTLAPTASITGSVISRDDARIAAEVEGKLLWLAEVGTPVEVGDVVARLEPRLLQVALTQAEASVARLEAELSLRERELERTEELALTQNVSATLLDERRAGRTMVRHQLAEARAQQERARGDLDRTELRAPFAGHVTERLAALGEYVFVGGQVLRLVDTRQREVVLPVPIAQIGFVAAGDSLDVLVGDGSMRSLPVRTVVPVGDEVSRMVEMRLDAAETPWIVGTPVKVSLPSGPAVDTVAVPRDALIERGGSASIFKVAADGTAVQVPADIVTTVGLWVGLGSGVEAGEAVIVRGAERLSPGQSVVATARDGDGSQR